MLKVVVDVSFSPNLAHKYTVADLIAATAWPRPYDTITDSIPDFIANCSMTRVFAYLMETGAEITNQAIFTDTSRVVGAALKRTHAENAQLQVSPNVRSRWRCGS